MILMSITTLIAKHLKEVYFGGNWTWANLKQALDGVTLEQANRQVHGFNTIYILTYHVSYYTQTINRVLEGQPLMGSDEDSFKAPGLQSEAEWQHFQEQIWKEAEKAVALITTLDDGLLEQDFVAAKYGNYYRNLHGMIEHLHYHLGQITLLKRLTMKENT